MKMWAIVVLACFSGATVARGQAVLKGSPEAQRLENAAKVAANNAYVDALAPFQKFASAPEYRVGKYEVVVEPQFFLLPERAQQWMLEWRVKKVLVLLDEAEDLSRAQQVLKQRGAEAIQLEIVYLDAQERRTIAGRYRLGPNGLKLFPLKTKAALAILDPVEADAFAALAEIVK